MPSYAVTIDQQNDRFIATFPDLPETSAVGGSFEEALSRAAQSLEDAIRGRFLAGRELPAPTADGVLRLQQDVLATVLA